LTTRSRRSGRPWSPRSSPSRWDGFPWARRVLPESLELLVLAAAGWVFALAFSSQVIARRALVVHGGAGLVAGVALALVPTLDLAALVVLVLGALDAAMGGRTTFAVRMRAPVLAAGLIALGLLLVRVEGPDLLGRFASVGLAAGLVAAIGLLPYIHPFEPDDSTPASPLVWMVVMGPVLAAVIVARAQSLLPVDAGEAFGAVLIGVGVLNMVWGALAAWLTSSDAHAWRYSFLADWGLVLCGFGLTLADGGRGALLVLFGLVTCRLPLSLLARVPSARQQPTEGPLNLLIAAALAGAAPFVGFAARVLLLRGATQLYWPLALALVISMLLWLPGSLRLGRGLGSIRGRRALAVAIVLAVNLVAGLYPQPLLEVAGL
jgi:hypothetical protein